jgi:hypothetical protein
VQVNTLSALLNFFASWHHSIFSFHLYLSSYQIVMLLNDYSSSL